MNQIYTHLPIETLSRPSRCCRRWRSGSLQTTFIKFCSSAFCRSKTGVNLNCRASNWRERSFWTVRSWSPFWNLSTFPQNSCGRSLARLLTLAWNTKAVARAFMQGRSIPPEHSISGDIFHFLLEQVCDGQRAQRVFFDTDALLKFPSAHGGFEFANRRLLEWIEAGLALGPFTFYYHYAPTADPNRAASMISAAVVSARLGKGKVPPEHGHVSQ